MSITIGDQTVLDLAALAGRMGWSNREVAAAENRRSRRRRAAGKATARDLPEPDGSLGREPYWLEATIQEWERHRPGQGTGGGRPSHRSTS
jgi:hypothetical protein